MKRVTDVVLLFQQYLIQLVRDPVWIVVSFSTPILYLALFTPLLKKLVGEPGLPSGNVLARRRGARGYPSSARCAVPARKRPARIPPRGQGHASAGRCWRIPGPSRGGAPARPPRPPQNSPGYSWSTTVRISTPL